MSKLLVGNSLIEAPFVTVTIGEHVLGLSDKSQQTGERYAGSNVPNYLREVDVKKINGAVNQYSIILDYAITAGNDPNLIDKILGTVSNSRTIYISYGDAMQPTFIFKNEKALITKVTQSISFQSAKITYTITAISDSILSQSIVKDWPARSGKRPSEIIIETLYNTSGLLEIFSGMQDKNLINDDIDQDDIMVHLEAKPNMSAFDYLNYLTDCMICGSDAKAWYTLTVYDTTEAPHNGTYFTVKKVTSSSKQNLQNGVFSIDVGYPGDSCVTAFTVDTQDVWSILYNYQQELLQSNGTYQIMNNGKISYETSNRLIKNTTSGHTEPEAEHWWKEVTSYPIQATLTLKGLLRPASLMQYVYINVYFYGRKHITSGLYIITQENDKVDQSGYRTTLKLLRVSGDDSII